MSNKLSREIIKSLSALPISDGCKRVTLDKTAFSAHPHPLNAKRAILTQNPVWPAYVMIESKKPSRSADCQLPADFGYSGRSSTMLPSFGTFKATGNPYPSNANIDANIASKGYERNRAFTAAHFIMFEILKDGQPRSAADFAADSDNFLSQVSAAIADQFKSKNFKIDPVHKNGNEFTYSLLHALQELEACGSLVVPQDGKRTFKTQYALQPALVEYFNANNSENAAS